MRTLLHPSVGLLILRLGLGIIFAAHGAQKLFGAFGGFGHAGTTQFFSSLGIPLPSLMAWVVGFVEFGGGLLIIVGLLTQLFAAALAADMLVAILTVKLGSGLFAPQGFELELMLLAAALTLVFTGPGRIAIEGRRAPAEPATG